MGTSSTGDSHHDNLEIAGGGDEAHDASTAHDRPVQPPADPRGAFEHWERSLDAWVRESLRCYCRLHQARGELFERGFSGNGVAVDEIDQLLKPIVVPDADTAFVGAARSARFRMWQALDACDAALEGRFLWTHIRRCFSLQDDEVELLLLTYTATNSPSLQRALRFAWNDFGRKLPTAGFLWELARPERGETGLERLADIVHLSNLVIYQLLETMDPYPSPVFAQVRLHPSISAVLGAEERSNLGDVRRVTTPGAPAEMRPTWDEWDRAESSRTWLLIGPPGSGRTTLAFERAGRLGYGLTACRITEKLAAAGRSAVLSFTRSCIRDAALLGAALHIEQSQHLQEKDGLLDSILDSILEPPVPVSLALMSAPCSIRSIARLRATRLEPPERGQRFGVWDEAIGERIRPSEIQDLAARYPLTRGQIRRAVTEADWRHQQPARTDYPRALSDLLHEEARNVLHRDVKIMATPVVTRLTWDDLVLPEDTTEQLWDIVRYVRHRRYVFDDWNFSAKFDYGTAVTALMTGPPGTGKTMSCALVARELGLELYRVSLPQIVSKWVGETEKNIDRIFEFSEQHGVALLFDEADSLFGKRGNVESASDRYANMETNFLLQRLEQFQGVAFLTTNLAKGLDEAFERRLRFQIEFPEPDVDMRLKLWQTMIPAAAPVDSSIDYAWLARAFELSGAHIKEAVLTGAFLAADADSPITTDLLCRGANEQYRKIGKLSTATSPR